MTFDHGTVGFFHIFALGIPTKTFTCYDCILGGFPPPWPRQHVAEASVGPVLVATDFNQVPVMVQGFRGSLFGSKSDRGM